MGAHDSRRRIRWGFSGDFVLHYRRKYVNLRWAMDICMPTVLLAQAIGRWGNFFNSEVYGTTPSYYLGLELASELDAPCR
jgi:prolipoprotein diacylglyceryltransferase